MVSFFLFFLQPHFYCSQLHAKQNQNILSICQSFLIFSVCGKKVFNRVNKIQNKKKRRTTTTTIKIALPKSVSRYGINCVTSREQINEKEKFETKKQRKCMHKNGNLTSA